MKKLKYIFFLFIFLPIISFADQTITTASDHSNGGYETCYGVVDRAEKGVTFTPAVTGSVSVITYWAKKTGSPTNVLTVAIEGDAGGSPNDTPIGTGTLSSATLTGTLAQEDITLSSPVSLTNGVPYWIVWSCDTQSSSDYINIGISDSSGNTSKTKNIGWDSFSSYAYATFDVVEGGGGGGMGTTTSNATSTIDQTQQNFFNAICIFLGSFVIMYWLLKNT